MAYNEANGITPRQIVRARNSALLGASSSKDDDKYIGKSGLKAYVEPERMNIAADPVMNYMTKPQMEKSIERTRKLMQESAKKLDFIEAAQYRDELLKMEDMMKEKWG